MAFPQDFHELVAEMRSRQKEYFRTRSDAAMGAAKALEREVDRRLAEHARGQRPLFEE